LLYITQKKNIVNEAEQTNKLNKNHIPWDRKV
jgi:hypothetical protein